MHFSRRKFIQALILSLVSYPISALSSEPNIPITSSDKGKLPIHMGNYMAVAFNESYFSHYKIASDMSNADLLSKAGFFDQVTKLYWFKMAVESFDKNSIHRELLARGNSKVTSMAYIVAVCSSGKVLKIQKNRDNVEVDIPNQLHTTKFKTIQLNWLDQKTHII